MTNSHKKPPPGMISLRMLRQRPDWTDTGIEIFLGQPDIVTHLREDNVGGPMIHLFAEERIQAVERSVAWRRWVSRAEQRRKRWLRRQWIATKAPIYVSGDEQSVAILVQEAMRSVIEHRTRNGLSVEGFAVSQLPAADLERILTNYIRHRYTNYDQLVKKLDQQPGDPLENYILLRRRVLKAMSQAFPDLREVFKRQLAAREQWDVEKAARLAA